MTVPLMRTFIWLLVILFEKATIFSYGRKEEGKNKFLTSVIIEKIKFGGLEEISNYLNKKNVKKKCLVLVEKCANLLLCTKERKEMMEKF